MGKRHTQNGLSHPSEGWINNETVELAIKYIQGKKEHTSKQ